MFDDLAAGAFLPEQTITRAEIVKTMNKLFLRRPISVTVQASWTDTPESHPNYGDIMAASIVHPYSRLENGTEVWTD